MIRHSIRNGLYRSATGRFWWRTKVGPKRTWRRLASATIQDARAESAALKTDHQRARLGLCRDPLQPQVGSVNELIDRYTADPQACRHYRFDRVRQAFGHLPPGDLTLPLIHRYGETRPPRSADLELAGLSSVLSWAVRRGLLPLNPIRVRPRFQRSDQIRHARESMPRDGDELNALALRLLPSATGWQLLFAALTGCRASELVRFRTDARSRSDPGFVEGRYLYVRRAKNGVNPFVEITPELADLLSCHRVWHASVSRGSPWFFPGRDLFRPLAVTSLTNALHGTGRTAHGLRAYYVTLFRSRGESDEQVASRIGDKTSSLIWSVYGALPEVWSGGSPLSWLPTVGEPAWASWRPKREPGLIEFPRLEVG